MIIPHPGFSTNGHLMAAFDYLHGHPEHLIPSNNYGFLHALGTRFRGSWDRLVDSVHASNGPTIISQEVLAVLSSARVAALVDDFRDIPVRAIAMFRPVSALIPSAYQQEARLMEVPAFEDYVRRCVSLHLSGGEHEFLWLDSVWLRKTWQDAGVPLEMVNPGSELTSEALTSLMCRLLPSGVAPPAVSRENPDLSAYGVDVWRGNLRACSPT